jgi:hypothetical protein
MRSEDRLRNVQQGDGELWPSQTKSADPILTGRLDVVGIQRLNSYESLRKCQAHCPVLGVP